MGKVLAWILLVAIGAVILTSLIVYLAPFLAALAAIWIAWKVLFRPRLPGDSNNPQIKSVTPIDTQKHQG